MNTLAEEEEIIEADLYGFKERRGRESSGQDSLLRLVTAMVAALAVLFILGTGAAPPAQAQVESVLYSFTGGSDGQMPFSGLIMDSLGNLYGTTPEGGSTYSSSSSPGDGALFELVYDSSTNSYTKKVLYNFTGTDGHGPVGNLIMDSSGDLYGTTAAGGSTFSSSPPGGGTVFELVYNSSTHSYTEQVLYSFTGSDGYTPLGGVIMDSAGNLYGTTLQGGSSNEGTVFELVYDSSTKSYTEKVLYSFTGPDGASPQSNLIMDSSGNLYGTTQAGGPSFSLASSSIGAGTVFELYPDTNSPTGYSEKGLYSFTGSDGEDPEAGLIMDSSGNLYGTTLQGGASSYGTVFELVHNSVGNSYKEQVLYSFTGGNDGSFPDASLVMDSAGNLYSTTQAGGSADAGNVFELVYDSSTKSYAEKVLHSFTGSDGYSPFTGLIMDPAGNLYGDTPAGGSTFSLASSPIGNGTVFGIVPVTLSDASLDFGTVGERTTSPEQTVTITNIGGGNFSYNTVSLSGTNAADFAIASNTCGTAFPPNGTCSVSVTFTPSTTGSETAALNLSQGGMTQTVSLTGTGALPTAGLSPTSLTFSSQPVGTTGSAQTVTVTNSSTVTLHVTAVGITGDFAIAANTCTAPIDAGKSCTVGVSFTPTASGARTGTLTFTDDASPATQTVALSGTGTPPAVTLSPSSLTFSGTLVGNTASAQSVTLTNSGTSSLTISGITVSGEFAVSAARTTCSTSTALAASSSCTIAVTFTPTAAGTRSGSVTITDDASPTTQTVALSGVGEDFTLAGGTASQTVNSGATATYALQLSPEGGFNQAVSLTCSGAPTYATCTVTPASATLDGTSNASVSVKVITFSSTMLAPGPGNFGPPPGSLPVAWLSLLGLLGLIALAKFSPQGGRVRRAAPWATLALLAALCAGCGGGGSQSSPMNNFTPPGTYTLTVTGTSGSVTHSSQLTLKVQ